MEYGLLGVLTALMAAVLGTITAWAVLTFIMGVDWVFLGTPVVVVQRSPSPLSRYRASRMR